MAQPGMDHMFTAGTAAAEFGIGFIMRPVAGVVPGAFAGRHGRKGALVISVVMMAVTTAATGLIPTYGSIGILAPALLGLAAIRCRPWLARRFVVRIPEDRRARRSQQE
jgi:MHS family proline/betaine transporter-like MFS transporter